MNLKNILLNPLTYLSVSLIVVFSIITSLLFRVVTQIETTGEAIRLASIAITNTNNNIQKTGEDINKATDVLKVLNVK